MIAKNIEPGRITSMLHYTEQKMIAQNNTQKIIYLGPNKQFSLNYL